MRTKTLTDNAAYHTSGVMTGVAVVTFNGNGMLLANPIPILGQDAGEGLPVVGVESAIRQVFYFVVEPAERCSITTAEHPGCPVRPVVRSSALMIHFLFFLNR